MKQFLKIFYLVEAIGFLAFLNPVEAQDFKKVKIQVYRDMGDGKVVKKDTIISLADLEKVSHLLEADQLDELKTAIFLAEDHQTQIQSKRENGLKTLRVTQVEGADIQALDSATQIRVREAMEIANISLDQTGKSETPHLADQTFTHQADWEGKTIETPYLQSGTVTINRNDLSVHQEEELKEALNSPEVMAMLDKMDVDIEVTGNRPAPPTPLQFRLMALTPQDQHMFRKTGLWGVVDTLAFSQITLERQDSVYALTIEPEESGEMSITIKHFSGKVLLRDTFKGPGKKYFREIRLGKAKGNFFFLTIAQNGKLSHRRILPVPGDL